MSHEFRIDDFARLRRLGKGPKSQVWLVRHTPTSATYCLKELRREAIATKQEAEHVWNERKVLELLSKEEPPFPRCCRLYASMKDERALYFLLEFIQGAPLHKHFQSARGLDVARTRYYTAELVQTLAALHDRGIIYRDLKASNVMLDRGSGRLRLVDFGFAKLLEGPPEEPHLRRTASVCGTFHAMSPEVRRLEGVEPSARKGYTQAADWWSLGVLTFEMIAAKPPFGYRDGQTETGRTLRELAEESPASIDFSGLGGDTTHAVVADFIARLLESDPAARLGANGAEEVRSHAWFEGLDWASVSVQKASEPSGAAGQPPPAFDRDLGDYLSEDSASAESLEAAEAEAFAGF
eukprot:TRINITY_DN1298_c2_g1_i1.p1 TRINITY_DN1298_c2_g1~~TRINITY_DN1298_c2_g1_i1.p1  ORF type:complete len:352 (+),score=90.50 TRINITY_DN1298_c2_g1_i1:70-1125(+)